MPETGEHEQWKALQSRDWRQGDAMPKYDTIVREAQGLKSSDIRGKLNARKWYIILFCLLPFAQNYFIFWLIAKAFHYDQLKDLSLVLGTIITGTFVETVVIIKIIVQWVFTDINYEK